MNPNPLAFVTGGHGMIGSAIVSLLRANGWEVVAPPRVEMDVTDCAAVKQQIGKLTKVDLLVHAAGGVKDQLVSKSDPMEWGKIVDTHLRGAYLLVQEVIPKMNSGGMYLFIGSRSATDGKAGQSNYAAAKAGMIALSQSLAREFGDKKIRSHVLWPGYIPGKINSHLSKEVVEKIRQSHVLGEFSTPEDVAEWVLFLWRMPRLSGGVFSNDSRINPWT